MHTQARQAVEGNIWKLYVMQALTQALFYIPIIVLFFESFGLSMLDVFVLQVAFSVAVFLFEIPTGYCADRYGRKTTLIIGCALGTIGYCLYPCSTGFWSLLGSEIVIGLGVSFISGTMEAMTYDTLLQMGEPGKCRAVIGKQNFAEFSAEALCGLAGGFLAVISLTTPIWLTVIPFAAALAIAFTLVEPSRQMMQETSHWKAIWNVSMHALFRHRGLRSIILVHSLVSSMTLAMFWCTQPYQKSIGLPLSAYGFMHCCIVLVGAFSARFVVTLEKALDDRKILMSIAASVVVSYLALSLPPGYWGLAFFFVGRSAWGMMSPLTTDIINKMTTSDVRATVISMRSLLGRLIFVIGSPFIGHEADIHGMQHALLVAGLAGGFCIIVTFLRIRSVWKEIPS